VPTCLKSSHLPVGGLLGSERRQAVESAVRRPTSGLCGYADRNERVLPVRVMKMSVPTVISSLNATTVSFALCLPKAAPRSSTLERTRKKETRGRLLPLLGPCISFFCS